MSEEKTYREILSTDLEERAIARKIHLAQRWVEIKYKIIQALEQDEKVTIFVGHKLLTTINPQLDYGEESEFVKEISK